MVLIGEKRKKSCLLRNTAHLCSIEIGVINRCSGKPSGSSLSSCLSAIKNSKQLKRTHSQATTNPFGGPHLWLAVAGRQWRVKDDPWIICNLYLVTTHRRNTGQEHPSLPSRVWCLGIMMVRFFYICNNITIFYFPSSTQGPTKIYSI